MPQKGPQWTYSLRFEQVQVAVKSGLTVSAFDALSHEDQGYLVAYWRAKDRMRAWEQHLTEEAIEKAGRPKRK